MWDATWKLHDWQWMVSWVNWLNELFVCDNFSIWTIHGKLARWQLLQWSLDVTTAVIYTVIYAVITLLLTCSFPTVWNVYLFYPISNQNCSKHGDEEWRLASYWEKVKCITLKDQKMYVPAQHYFRLCYSDLKSYFISAYCQKLGLR